MKFQKMLFPLILFYFINALAYDWLLPDHLEGKFRQHKSSVTYLDDIYGYDVSHYNLYWDVTDTAGRNISGQVIISAQTEKPLDEFVFDLYDNIAIDSLIYITNDYHRFPLDLNLITRLNNRVITNLPDQLSINQTFIMQIDYHGQPAGGSLMGLTFATHGNNQSIVASLSEPQDSRMWWPCKDIPSDKATADIKIVTHSHQLAASNGLLQSITSTADNKLIYHWKTSYPTSTYLLSLAVSNYKKHIIYYLSLSDSNNMPIEIYAYPENELQTLEDCSVLPEMLKCFVGKLGEYPFLAEKYGIALFGWNGAMENQTCTTYGSSLINGQHTYDNVMAHELAHHWLGDLVTCSTWKDLWLQEGGASYLENIWNEYKYGQSAYLENLNKQKIYYLWEDSKARFPIYDPPLAYHFGKTTYDKGSWIYHMLRYLVGDTAFFAGMHSYFANPVWAYSNATTEQFISYLQNTAGVDLTSFKNEWIYSAGYPQYAWAYECDKNKLKIQLLQEQTERDNTPLFTTPVPIKISFANGSDSILIIQPTEKFQIFEFNFSQQLSAEVPNFNWLDKILSTQRIMPLDSVLYQTNGKALEIITQFPNPCQNELTLQFNIANYRMHDHLVYEIFNVLGQKNANGIITSFKPGYNLQTIRLDNLSKGVYFVKLHYEAANDYFDLVKFVVVR